MRRTPSQHSGAGSLSRLQSSCRDAPAACKNVIVMEKCSYDTVRLDSPSLTASLQFPLDPKEETWRPTSQTAAFGRACVKTCTDKKRVELFSAWVAVDLLCPLKTHIKRPSERRDQIQSRIPGIVCACVSSRAEQISKGSFYSDVFTRPRPEALLGLPLFFQFRRSNFR